MDARGHVSAKCSNPSIISGMLCNAVYGRVLKGFFVCFALGCWEKLEPRAWILGSGTLTGLRDQPSTRATMALSNRQVDERREWRVLLGFRVACL